MEEVDGGGTRRAAATQRHGGQGASGRMDGGGEEKDEGSKGSKAPEKGLRVHSSTSSGKIRPLPTYL
eukprot:2025466-Pyramimonas_sp.AAC.1